jgi:hypothetical protein
LTGTFQQQAAQKKKAHHCGELSLVRYSIHTLSYTNSPFQKLCQLASFRELLPSVDVLIIPCGLAIVNSLS